MTLKLQYNQLKSIMSLHQVEKKVCVGHLLAFDLNFLKLVDATKPFS